MKNIFFTWCFVLASFFSFQSNLYAINELISRVPGNYSQKPAYIENVALIAEPHGGYVEQSLYFEYADHGAFPGSKTVEIIHRFELPEGSVVNDMWLWIGDSVMQAVMMDTWTARHIYDSIVVMKRDPAFLSRVGNQYELHVYPLESGKTRKVKMNFITPTKWSGINALAELPLKFLKASASTNMGINLLFRVRENVWDIPRVAEDPAGVFTDLKDTLGIHYKSRWVGGIKLLQTFNLAFGINFSGGTFFSNNVKNIDANYFQFGIVPWQAYNITGGDTVGRQILTALDLSGVNNKNYNTLIPNLKSAIKAGLRQKDKFNIVVAGAGNIKKLSPSWSNYSAEGVDQLLDGFTSSAFGDSVKQNKKPLVVYCDDWATGIWSFTDLLNYADTLKYFTLQAARSSFYKADVVAAYKYGCYDLMTPAESLMVFASLDSLFNRGGRFMGYYDLNRVGKEQIAMHFIPSFQVAYHTETAITLKRGANGNISNNFPETLTHNGGYFFTYKDTSVKAEMVDDQGRPCVISKKLGNGGLLVMTGIWPFNDDIPMKKTFAVPLLGLNAIHNDYKLIQLLETVQKINQADTVDCAMVFSNCDSLTTNTGTSTWVSNYVSSFQGYAPLFKSVNLLDGSTITPSSATINGKEYYGAGYLMHSIAASTKGIHIETHLQDWASVNASLTPSQHPVIDSIKVTPVFSSSSDSLKEFREVNAVRTDADRPLFFLGSTNSTGSVKFNVDVKFAGDQDVKHITSTYSMNYDTSSNVRVIAFMLGYENLQETFNKTPWDTAGIISQALRYNLLCDYTALIALEPNNIYHFMTNPYDESTFVPNGIADKEIGDSLSLQIYPNPFNPSTSIAVSLAKSSSVEVIVYDILGREVSHLLKEDKASGKLHATWFGKDDFGKKTASGIYLICMRGKELLTGKTFTITKKAILLK